MREWGHALPEVGIVHYLNYSVVRRYVRFVKMSSKGLGEEGSINPLSLLKFMKHVNIHKSVI